MAHFRKKPVVIDAVRFVGSNLREALKFIEGREPDLNNQMAAEAWDAYAERVVREGGFFVRTLEDGPNGEARHFASIGDWIIRGVQGEFYPCKPEIFTLTYEPATEDGATLNPPGEVELRAALEKALIATGNALIQQAIDDQKPEFAIAIAGFRNQALDAVETALTTRRAQTEGETPDDQTFLAAMPDWAAPYEVRERLAAAGFTLSIDQITKRADEFVKQDRADYEPANGTYRAAPAQTEGE